MFGLLLTFWSSSESLVATSYILRKSEDIMKLKREDEDINQLFKLPESTVRNVIKKKNCTGELGSRRLEGHG